MPHEINSLILITNFQNVQEAICIKILKILGFVLNVEDYHKLTKTQFLIQSPRRTDVRVDKNIAILSSPMAVIGSSYK